jgi:hypothetical protein
VSGGGVDLYQHIRFPECPVRCVMILVKHTQLRWRSVRWNEFMSSRCGSDDLQYGNTTYLDNHLVTTIVLLHLVEHDGVSCWTCAAAVGFALCVLNSDLVWACCCMCIGIAIE